MMDGNPPRIQRFRQDLLSAIPCVPDAEEVRAELSSKSLGDLLLICVNWLDRRVAPRKRYVEYATCFWNSSKLGEHVARVFELERMIQEGDDLTPFLSDRIDEGFASKRADKKGRSKGLQWADKDLALNAYGLHHLHLGKRKASGRVAGSRDLLFVAFRRECAYFVMLGNHKSFNDGTLLRAVTEWRAETGQWVLNGVLPDRTQTDRDAQRLARHGIATHADVDGRAVMGALISTAGTSVLAGRHAARMHQCLREFDPKLDDPQWIERWFARFGRCAPAAPKFEWGLNYCDLILEERISSTISLAVPWWR